MEIVLGQLTHARLVNVIVDRKLNALEGQIHVQEKNANAVKMTHASLQKCVLMGNAYVSN